MKYVLSIILIILVLVDIILNIVNLTKKCRVSTESYNSVSILPEHSQKAINLMIPSSNSTVNTIIYSLKKLMADTKNSSLSVKKLLEKSINQAYKIVNSDSSKLETIEIDGEISNVHANPIRDLNDYFTFLSDYTGLIPGFNFRNPSEINRQEILNGICLFNFISDQPLSELDHLVISSSNPHGIFQNHLQYYPPFANWMADFTDSWGYFLDNANSWNDDIYEAMYNANCTEKCKKGFEESNQKGLIQGGAFTMKPIITKTGIYLSDGWYGQGNLWRSWNNWFSRILVCPQLSHPISEPDNTKIIISSSDSVPQGTWDINDNSDIAVHGGIQIKLLTYFNVNDLLKKDSKFINYFKGGKFTHTFLNVFDYHRYHYSVTGKVLETASIKQNVSLQVNWNSKTKNYEPVDSTGWQFSQSRSYVIVQVEGTNFNVALIPMGMSTVSSANITYPILPEDMPVYTKGIHKKGEGLGNFLFGASDFIMLFPKEANFVMTAPKNSDGTYNHILMGEEYGRFDI